MSYDKMFKFLFVASLLFASLGLISAAGQAEGEVLTSFEVDYNPELSFTSRGIAFDGEYVYVLVCMADYKGFRLLKMSPQDSSILSTTNLPELPYASFGGIEWDGTHLWVSIWEAPDRSVEIKGLYKIDLDTGQILQQLPIHFVEFPRGLAFDGENMWVSDNKHPSWVSLVNLTDGSELDFFLMPVPAHGLAFDGQFFWTSTGNRVFKVDPSTGSIETTFIVEVSEHCEGLTFVGGSLWMLDEHGLSTYYAHKLHTEQIVAPKGSTILIEGATGTPRIIIEGTEEPITITVTEEIIIMQEPLTETVTVTETKEQETTVEQETSVEEESMFIPGFSTVPVFASLVVIALLAKRWKN